MTDRGRPAWDNQFAETEGERNARLGASRKAARMSARTTVMDDVAIKRLQEFCDGTRGPYTNLAADLRFALDGLKDCAVRERVLSAERNRAQAACEQIGARLATVRTSALEEAAALADRILWGQVEGRTSFDVSDAIRALKDAP